MKKKCVAVKDGSFFRRTLFGEKALQSFLFYATDETLLYIQIGEATIISNVRGGIKDFWIGQIETKHGLSEIEEIKPETLLTSENLRVRKYIKEVLEKGVFTFIEET